MTSRRNIGKKGEDEAVYFLKSKGYEILERNYRSGRSEIDIIARYRELLVFAEVKVRSSNTFGFPEEFVSDEQAARITDAAEEYQYQIDWQGDIRFDIISIEKRGTELRIRHFEDAFY